ncbi:HAD family hydrolase [Alysiella filiformis]|uniref:Haloacid dehalogenase-like hydrolase n=1 Tax=Alysiella filiformis DSM 16848 TaxID=1120981 RepID=A0A286E3F6_9NEIS|nr:HAD family hydrolase [Alysiella filiformis]QMT31091.1 HAD family hydrolase [Alysiella filiformis]UBQ55917.1 HAD-IB family hydrolase [Alysiella filiformis DSM 16848]SOD65437.1 haloacid dehalogenase-like hydrolase [Alysiella filiformis DSM 16848]
MKKFAFFDFDGTLTRTDTVLPFLKYACANRADYYAKLLRQSPVLLAYLLGCASNLRAKEAVFTEFLAGQKWDAVQNVAHDFARFRLPELLLPAGMQVLREHQARGDFCVLVSASPEIYLHEWGRINGLDAVLGTRLQVVAGCLTGRVDGENCHDWGKVRRIEAQFGTNCWANSVAYSDSAVDLPMLQQAAQGFLGKKGQFVRVQ